jgi:hypothetical protein
MATKEVSTVNSTNYLIISDNDQNQVIINQPNSNIIQVTIPQNANNITQNENIVVVNDPSSKQINIIDQGVRVIQLTTLGPQGPQGIPGPSGNPFPFTGSAIISGSLIITGSVIATQGFTGSLFGSSSYALTASFALNAGTTIDTGSFVTTSSFNSFTSSVNNFTSSYNTGSFTGSFIGSLVGTSSYSNQSLSSSYALTASFALNAGTTVDTGSFVTTSSFNNFTSSFNNFTSSYNTGSFTGSFTGNGSGLFNISASGIVGLNLSQIATGSISASVSTGSGSFTVTSGSTNLLFISSSGGVGIGITDSITSKLQIRGTGISTTTALRVENSNTTASLTVLDNAQVNIGTANQLAGTLRIERGQGNTGLILQGSNGNIIGSSDNPVYEPYNFTNADHNFNIGHPTLGNYNWYAGSNGTLNANTFLMRLTRSGSLLIGTTTDSIYRLNVSGSGNFSNNLTVTGSLSITGSINLNSGSINNLAAPASPSSAATKAYVDEQIATINIIDMFGAYKIFEYDEAGTTSYLGETKATNNAWLITRYVENGGDITANYANVSNNAIYTTPTTAWTARVSLNYTGSIANLSGL